MACQCVLLDTRDFADFSRAVAQRIATPGMCYTKLRRKAAADDSIEPPVQGGRRND